jgi:hypothetical protein
MLSGERSENVITVTMSEILFDYGFIVVKVRKFNASVFSLIQYPPLAALPAPPAPVAP